MKVIHAAVLLALLAVPCFPVRLAKQPEAEGSFPSWLAYLGDKPERPSVSPSISPAPDPKDMTMLLKSAEELYRFGIYVSTYGKPYCTKRSNWKCDEELTDTNYETSDAGHALFLSAAVVRSQEARKVMLKVWGDDENATVRSNVPSTDAENRLARKVYEVSILAHLARGEHDYAIKAYEESTRISRIGTQDYTHLLAIIHDRCARDGQWAVLERMYRHVMEHIWVGDGTFPIQYVSEMPGASQWAIKRNLYRMEGPVIPRKEVGAGPSLPQSHKRLVFAVVSGGGFSERATTSAFMASLQHRDKTKMTVRCFDGKAHERIHQVQGATYRQCDTIVSVGGTSSTEFALIINDERVHIMIMLDGASPGAARWEGLIGMNAAPLQASVKWGVPHVDVTVSDSIRAPPEYALHHNSKLMMLTSHPLMCIRPPKPSEEPRSGWVAMAYLGLPRSLERETFSTWLRAMRRVPRSRILLPATRREMNQKKGGFLAEERLEREASLFAIEHTRMSFAEDATVSADIILEPLTPGMESTGALEALARSLPVVTSPGEAHESRESAGVVSAMSRWEGVTREFRDYEEVLVRMAKLLGSDKGEKWRKRLGLTYFGGKKKGRSAAKGVEDKKGRCGEFSRGWGTGSRISWEVKQELSRRMHIIVSEIPPKA